MRAITVGCAAMMITMFVMTFPAPAQDTPMPAPEVKAAIDTWVSCSASVATRYAAQPGDVGDVADAALGACADDFERFKATAEKSESDKAAAAGVDADFIARDLQSTDENCRRARSNLRARLMSLIIETRMRKKK